MNEIGAAGKSKLYRIDGGLMLENADADIASG